MTKKELAKKIAESAEMTQTQASECLSAVLDCIGEALQQGNKVVLPGFGTFSVSNRAERQGKNPSTGESITIPASKVPKFKAGSVLKDKINQHN
jgi:DNA-binding protein HU-beta